MYLSQYQAQAKETAIYPEDKALEYLALGLVGEAGEVANKIKKVIRDGTSPNNVRDELGDVLWYLAMLSTEIGYSLDTIADKNLWKLANRKERNVLGGSGDNR
tara:strand:+ start:559 stop:867 length:309 start_codon:yes stop_codon:yes gene_type:complete